MTSTQKELVLVTGSAGFLGSRCVDFLLRNTTMRVRCFVRAMSDLSKLNACIKDEAMRERVEFVRGDLLSKGDCERAADGVSIAYHLAAGMDKSFAGCFMNSALATRNLAEAFLDRGKPGRFVSVSSFAVYSNLRLSRGAVLDETCPLEDDPQARYDAYGFGKLKQEEIVRELGKTRGLRWVMLRPGVIFGPGKKGITGRVGIDTFGFFVHVGGANVLPLTYVDNCAEAIVLAGYKEGVDGEVYNVVDDGRVTSADLLKVYKRASNTRFSLRLPYTLAYAFSAFWEDYSKSSQGQVPPAFNRRRCHADWKGQNFPNTKIKQGLGWQPRVPMSEALERYAAQYATS